MIQEKRLPLNHLVESLFSRRIISERDKDEITDARTNQTTNDRMSRLLDIVAVTVKCNGAVFGQLLEIFEQEGAARGKDLADVLKNKYYKYKQNFQHTGDIRSQ